ncbi:MAG: MBL fold metallo-hydrolase [Deltaproteobacteria bacterium]
MKIHTIDTNFFSPSVIASYLIETSEGPIIVETGPDSTFPALKRALGDLGYAPADIRHVFVTHIHLDHAGSSWRFAEEGAKVYVHPNGAKHLADPTKLLASAALIYKDKMDELWGTLKPIAKELIHPIADGERITIGGVEIQAVETLGHASHHHAFMMDGAMFTGDAAGMKVANGPVLPPTPPPDINIEAWQETIRKILALKPSALHLTHFGTFHNIAEHLAELEAGLLESSDWIGAQLKAGKSEEEISAGFEKFTESILQRNNVSDPKVVRAYDLADPYWMNVMGLVRYWKKFRGA